MPTDIGTSRGLLAWQKAIVLARGVYHLPKRFPRDERFGLTRQVRRAVVSVSSNVAAGHARQGREFAHFLSVARGSLAEVESPHHLSVALGFLADDIRPCLATEYDIHRMTASPAAKLAR